MRARHPGDLGGLNGQAGFPDLLHVRPFVPDSVPPKRPFNPITGRLCPRQRCLVLSPVTQGEGESEITHALVLPWGSSRPGWTWWTPELEGA